MTRVKHLLQTRMLFILLLCLGALMVGPAAFAQSSAEPGAQPSAEPVTVVSEVEDEGAPELAIDILDGGILYNESGELVIQTIVTNVGTVAVPPLDVTAILLTDCILTAVPQTCRFGAFGSFGNVLPNGLAAGSSTVWTFNFGVYPDLDLDRWSVIWYPVAAAPSGAAQ